MVIFIALIEIAIQQLLLTLTALGVDQKGSVKSVVQMERHTSIAALLYIVLG